MEGAKVGRCESGKVRKWECAKVGRWESSLNRKKKEGKGGIMAFAERFEELEIWQEARRLAGLVYAAFRGCKDFGFRNQIQEAAVSVMNNIAEGFERRSTTEFRRFLDIAKGSSGEVRSMLYLAQDIEHLSKDQALHLIAEYEKLSKRISSLMCKLTRK